MKQYRDDVRGHAEKFGRNPDDIKVLFLVYPILAETDEEAQAKRQRMMSSPALHRAGAGRDRHCHRHRLLEVPISTSRCRG